MARDGVTGARADGLTDGLTAFEAVTLYFDEAAGLIDLDDDMRSILTTTYREIAVQVPVRLDDGRLIVASGYRVQHNGARGPYKGGVRYHPTVDLEEVRALAEAVGAGGRVGDYEGEHDAITNDELLTYDCDVLVPAALGAQIHEGNAGLVRAKVVVEGANYPTTPKADRVLQDRGVVVVPDVLANAGGVTGSYFEWTMNVQQFRWKPERFQSELADKLGQAYAATRAFADAHACTLRQAAFAIGIQRVAEASHLRGYI